MSALPLTVTTLSDADRVEILAQASPDGKKTYWVRDLATGGEPVQMEYEVMRIMAHSTLVKYVRQMREAQAEYFRHRSDESLQVAKQRERAVDGLLAYLVQFS